MSKNKKKGGNITFSHHSAFDKLFSPKTNLDAKTILVKTKQSPFKLLLARMHDLQKKAMLKTDDLFPQQLCDIPAVRRMPLVDLFHKEILWAILPLFQHSVEINHFLALKRDFELAFLNGNVDNACDIFTKLVERFGQSFWAVEAEFLLRSYGNDLQENRKLLGQVKKQAAENALLKVYSQVVSMRIEANVSNTLFNKHIQEFYKIGPEDNEAVKRLLNFIKFSTNFANLANTQEVKLWGFMEFTLVDRYLLLLRTLQIIYSSYDFQLEQHYLVDAIKMLSKKIHDPQLYNLSLLVNPKVENLCDNIDSDMDTLVDNYTRGNYEKVVTDSQYLIHRSADCFEYYDLYLNSLIHAGLEFRNPFPSYSLSHAILRYAYSLKIKDINAPASHGMLLKIANILGMSRLSNAIIAFARNNKHSNIPIDNTTFEVLNYSAPTPRFSIGYHNISDAQKYLDNLKRTCSMNSAFTLYSHVAVQRRTKKLIQCDITVPHVRKQKYLAYGLLSSGNISAAAEKYHDLYLATKSDPLTQTDTIEHLLKCYFQLQDYRSVLDIIIDTYLTAPNQLLPINLLHLHDKVKQKPMIINSNLIGWPIYYSILYKEDILPQNYMHLYELYDEFMMSNRFRRIRDINLPPRELSRLIYFLCNVCTSNVIDNSVEFASTDELEAEIISKLQTLKTLDPHRAETYSEEIRQITQSAKIRSAIHHINQSKIYIDIASVRSSFLATYEGVYKRYCDYLRLSRDLRLIVYIDPDKDLDAITQTLQTIYDNSQSIYEDEAVRQFMMLFDSIKTRYTSSLDSYLSTRIRHGTLSGEIRSVLEKAHLLTQKNKSDEYESNFYWIAQLKLDKTASSKLDDHFKEFSKAIDGVINRAKSDWIQINSPEKPEGVFNYSYKNEELTRLFDTLSGPNIQIEQFVEKVIEYLDNQTAACLSVMRHRIQDDIQADIITHIEHLSEQIERLLPPDRRTEIRHTINRCRTDVSNCLTNIAGWFGDIGKNTSPDFGLTLLVSTVTEIINNCNPGHELKPRIEMSNPHEVTLKGAYFVPLVDILIAIFTNMIVHAKETLGTARILANVTASALDLEISNQLPDGADIEKLNAVFATTRENISAGLTKDIAMKEGGTGLYKIQEILKGALHQNPPVYSFGVVGRAFNIKIKLDLKELRV